MTKVGTFLKGAVLGAALGLLFAPKSGDELRKDLMQKKEEAKDRAKEYSDMAKEKGENLHQVAKETTEDIQVTLKDSYNEAKEEAKPEPPKKDAPKPGPSNDDTVVEEPAPYPPVEPLDAKEDPKKNK